MNTEEKTLDQATGAAIFHVEYSTLHRLATLTMVVIDHGWGVAAIAVAGDS